MAMFRSEDVQKETDLLLSDLTGLFRDEEDSSDEEDFGDTPDWHDMTRTGNERAHTIRTVCKMRPGNLSIFELYYYASVVGEVLLSADLPAANREELLDGLAKQHPLFDKYRSLDKLTLALVCSAFHYFLHRRAAKMKAEDPQHGAMEVKRLLAEVKPVCAAMFMERERIRTEQTSRQLAEKTNQTDIAPPCGCFRILSCWS